jgi:hypothetical protein
MSPPASLPYGPQTARIRHFLQRLAAQPAMVWLAAARHADHARDDAALRLADRALGDAIARLGREHERDALVGPILQMARRAAATAAVEDDDAGIERLAEPALAAALALLVADALPPEHVQALYGPWAGVIPFAAEPGETSPPGETRNADPR